MMKMISPARKAETTTEVDPSLTAVKKRKITSSREADPWRVTDDDLSEVHLAQQIMTCVLILRLSG